MVRSSAASCFGLDVLEPRQLLAFAIWDGGGGDSEWHNRETTAISRAALVP